MRHGAKLVAMAGIGGTSGRSFPARSKSFDEVWEVALDLAIRNGQPTQITMGMQGARGGPEPCWNLRAVGNWTSRDAIARTPHPAFLTGRTAGVI